MNDSEDLLSGGEMPEIIGHSFENNLQEELGEILEVYEEILEVYDSDPEKEDFVMDDDCVLFENDLDNMEQNVQITDANIASFCKYKDKNVLHLTSEEEGMIKQCTDLTLQGCLMQNRLKMQQLKQLYTRLTAIRNYYRDNLRRECEKLSQQGETKMVYPPKTLIYKLGMPYFKDRQCYGSPLNIDSLSKVQNKELTITQFREGRRWMDWHQMRLLNGVETSYYKYCKSQLEQQISDIEWQLKKTDGDVSKEDLQIRLDTFHKQLEALNKEKPRKTPPYGSNVGIDWLLIADVELKGCHTVHECKAMWNIYLHPHINKKDWNAEENAAIKELVIKYRYEDWDSLARELGTNRSGYLVCVHYYTKLCDKFRRHRFLPSEDESLLEIVESCRLGAYIPWGRVASYFEDRSKHQLYHRYKYYLSCKNNAKGIFTEAEDILLVHLIRVFGKDFTKASKYMPHRTCIQLRNRYTSYLTHLTPMNLGNYTCVDDEKILEHVRVHGEKWTDLARELSRTRSHVRQRYMTLKKWLDKNPSMKIEDVPRRKQTYLLQSSIERQRCMEAILKKLEDSHELANLSAVETLLKQQKKPSSSIAQWQVRNKQVADTVSDHRLLDFVQGSDMPEIKTPSADLPVDKCAQRVYKLLQLLGADVNKLVKDANIEGEDASLLTDSELEILKTLKGHSSDAAIPSTFHSMLQYKPQVKYVMPPNWHTLLGLRTFLLKFELYKETTGQSFSSNVCLQSSKTGLEDAMLWKLEQNLLKLDEDSRAKVIGERKLFTTRFKALFKWPCLLSLEFPKSLKDSSEGVKGSEIVIASPKSGRFIRRTYPKVLRMLEAKKRKLKPENTSDETSDDPDDPPNGNKVTQQQGKPKKSEYAVRYVPKRTKIKKVQKKKVDAEGSNETVTEENQLGISKIINISELNLPARNVPLIDSNVLAKLGKANSKNKIVILKQVPTDKIQKLERVTKMYNLPELCDVDNQTQTSTSNSVQNKRNLKQKNTMKSPKQETKEKQVSADKIQKLEKVTKTYNLPVLCDVDNQAQASTSSSVQNKRNSKRKNTMKSSKQETKEKQVPVDKVQKRKKVTKTYNRPKLCDVDDQNQVSTSNSVQNKRNPRLKSTMNAPKQQTKEKQVQDEPRQLHAPKGQMNTPNEVKVDVYFNTESWEDDLKALPKSVVGNDDFEDDM